MVQRHEDELYNAFEMAADVIWLDLQGSLNKDGTSRAGGNKQRSKQVNTRQGEHEVEAPG